MGVKLGNAVTALLLLRMLDADFVGYSSQLRDAILSLLVGSIVALIACVVPWTERATRLLSTRLNHFGGSSCLCCLFRTLFCECTERPIVFSYKGLIR